MTKKITDLEGRLEAAYKRADSRVGIPKNKGESLKATASRCGVPDHMIDGLILYLTDRIEPGGFMLAFLENDLMGAMGRADNINRYHFFEIADFVYNHMPSNSHGNRDIVAAWLKGDENGNG